MDELLTSQTSEATENTEVEEIPFADDEDLFSDLDGEETPEESPEDGDIPKESDEPTSEPEEESVIAKYNGQEIPLSKKAVSEISQALGMTEEQYIATVQKGMNYDHVLNERDQYKNAREIAVLDEYAKANGMSRQDFVDYLAQNREQVLLEQEQEALESKYPDTNPELLAEVAQKNVKDRQREQIERQEAQRQQEVDAKTQSWKEFFVAYPDLKVPDIPQEVNEAVLREGITPLQAMYQHENRKLKAELEAMKTNKKNKEKAIGSTKSVSQDEGDAFLSGFLGG